MVLFAKQQLCTYIKLFGTLFLTSTHDYRVILPNATLLFYKRERKFTAFAAYCMFFQAIRQLETEIETTRKAMIANAGTQGSLEKRLLDYRGNLI